MSEQFWTDTGQADQRIRETYVMYEDSPVYIRRVMADGTVDALRYPSKMPEILRLDDPKWGKFRTLPPTGWVNSKQYKTAVYLARRPRRTQKHGLSSENTSSSYFNTEGFLTPDHISLDRVFADEGYQLACKQEYPTLTEVLSHVREGSTLAVSKLYAVYRDASGIRWLCRETVKVGLFAGSDTLLLLNKHSYLKEELQATKTIDVSNIKEF